MQAQPGGPAPAVAGFEPGRLAAELAGITGLTGESTALVKLLANSLEAKDASDLERWAELDLVSVFARPENIARPAAAPAPKAARPARTGATAAARVLGAYDAVRTRLASMRQEGWERAAEAVLGVLVFVPLLVTWSGLALAAGAYGRLASGDSTQSTRPFLQLWESGFDGRLPGWARFGDIAVTAVVFISMLLLLSAVHSLARHRAQSEADRLEAERELKVGELVAVFTRVQFVVRGFRIDAPTRLNETLSQSTGQLTTLLEGSREAHDTATEVIGQVGALTQRLDEVCDRIAQAAEALRQVQEQGVEAIERAVLAAADQMRSVQQESADAAKQATESATASMRQTLETLRQLHEQAAGVAERAAGESQEVVREGVRALRATQEAALASLREAREAMAHSTAQGADAVESVGAALRGTGDRIDAALRTLADAQDVLSRRSGDAAAAADKSAASMREMARVMATAISELRHSVERWDAAAAHWENAAAAVERRHGPAVHPAAPRMPAQAQPYAGQPYGVAAQTQATQTATVPDYTAPYTVPDQTVPDGTGRPPGSGGGQARP